MAAAVSHGPRASGLGITHLPEKWFPDYSLSKELSPIPRLSDDSTVSRSRGLQKNALPGFSDTR
jgi:hypothetical protein